MPIKWMCWNSRLKSIASDNTIYKKTRKIELRKFKTVKTGKVSSFGWKSTESSKNSINSSNVNKNFKLTQTNVNKNFKSLTYRHTRCWQCDLISGRNIKTQGDADVNFKIHLIKLIKIPSRNRAVSISSGLSGAAGCYNANIKTQ